MKKKKVIRISGFSAINVSEKLINDCNCNISKFLYKYICCEITCKQIISAVDDLQTKNIKMHLTTIKKCMKIYGVVIDEKILSSLFSASSKKNERSCKVLRDSLVHGLPRSVIEEISARYLKLNEQMDMYLRHIKECV